MGLRRADSGGQHDGGQAATESHGEGDPVHGQVGWVAAIKDSCGRLAVGESDKDDEHDDGGQHGKQLRHTISG